MPIAEKACSQCSKTFTPSVHNQKYCSAACREQRTAEAHGKRHPQKVCPQCGKAFTPFGYQKYCSGSCREQNFTGPGGARKARKANPMAQGRAARLGADDVPIDAGSSASGGPFYGKRMIVTGELEHMTRDAARQLIKNSGGLIVSSITKKTNIVVMGANPGPKKIEKLEELKQEGVDIEIIDEDKFSRLLGR